MKLCTRFCFYCFTLLLSPIWVFSKHIPIESKRATILFNNDTTRPTVYCLTGVITVPLPSTGCITIFAKDLDRGSFDNVTASDNLKFYFNGERSKSSLTICCDDFVAANVHDELLVKVHMWVEDEAGNTDSCETTLIIQDILSVCPSDPGAPFYSIKGNITYYGSLLGATNTILTGPNGMHLESDKNPYGFYNLPNGSYTVCVERNDDPLNGVSTADIVMIRRHILGTVPLTSPYQLIAADVNLSKSTTASDLSEIKKLILGVTTKFNKVPSWIFIPSDFTFTSNVFTNFPTCKTLKIKDNSNDKVDFIGVKMGDVNGSARGHN